MTKVGAILLDTRSIQKYVFSCNKLQTNAGASFIVDDIFKHKMIAVLKEEGLKQPDSNSKQKDKDSSTEKSPIKMLDDDSIECEVAYIGGGNMLILLRLQDDPNLEKTLEKGKEIVGKWSKELLLKAPGLKTGAAIGTLDLATERFQESLDALYKQLKENQNTILPQVDLPYTGFTLECDTSGKTADVIDYTEEESRWISSEVKAKKTAFKYATEQLSKKYEDILGEKIGEKVVPKYEFVKEFDSLGYKDGESYICVVHIDGNNMGVKFGKCRTMQERKELSAKVANIVKDSFRKVLSSIVREYDSYKDFLDLTLSDSGKKILPIRPIIIGGDDVTFVCPGRVGIVYAKRFIEAVNSYELLDDKQYKYMCKDMDKNTTLNQKMSCCGGIAIVPAKYPFFRAYELAEQLCSKAKEKSRQTDNSLIDFAILHGDMYSSIDQLREDQYCGVEGGLHYGPYSIDQKQNDKSHIDDLIMLMDRLRKRTISAVKSENREKVGVAENKIKKLREVLKQDEHSITLYLELTTDMKNILCRETRKNEVTAKDFWQKRTDEKENKTRYIDAIEIMDFMPLTLSKEVE